MDITGARWGLAGAEAILKLRALKANRDFDAYWQYHLAQEHRHIHQARYHNHVIPQAKCQSLTLTSEEPHRVSRTLREELCRRPLI
jgi:hypothetical protein